MKYEFDRHLGSGSFGLVREAINKATKERVAIKTVWKSNIPDQDFLRKEIEILLSLDHKYIIKCHEVYEDITCVNFVFELIKGGELFDFIINSNSGKLDQKLAMDIFMQMIDAVHYMHSEGFVHRDIKPENFLIHTINNKYEIKLIDFGFATDFKQGEKLTAKVGSINYVAPEMLLDDGFYDYKVDIWAIGICLYNMLAGKQPFADEDIEALTMKIKNDPVKFEYPQFNTVDSNIKKIIEKILIKTPDDRPSAGEIKINPWISKFIGLDEAPTTVEEFKPNKNIKNIQNLLKATRNMKPIFWEFCMNNLNLDLYRTIYVSSIQFKSFFLLFYLSYYYFLE